jgi:hypothetical protein
MSLLFCSLSFSVSFEQSSWCQRPMLLGGGRVSKATYQSRVHAAKGPHSISVLSFRLGELRLGHLHPIQIKRCCEIVRILPLISSSTANQPSPLLVLLPIHLQAAQPPFLSNHRFEIGPFPLNFVVNVGYTWRGGEGRHRQGCRTKGRASRHHDVWL